MFPISNSLVGPSLVPVWAWGHCWGRKGIRVIISLGRLAGAGGDLLMQAWCRYKQQCQKLHSKVKIYNNPFIIFLEVRLAGAFSMYLG